MHIVAEGTWTNSYTVFSFSLTLSITTSSATFDESWGIEVLAYTLGIDESVIDVSSVTSVESTANQGSYDHTVTFALEFESEIAANQAKTVINSNSFSLKYKNAAGEIVTVQTTLVSTTDVESTTDTVKQFI